jgi:hypothetical protein
MQKLKTTPLMFLFALMLAFLFSVSTSYASSSNEVERIEYGDNQKITYFKNGTKLVEIFGNVNIGITAGAHVRAEPFLIPKESQLISTLRIIDLIFSIIHHVICAILGILGVLGITLYIRRKKKPQYIVISDKNILKR